MEHDSLYTTVREKLENRKIVPSDNAWNALQAKLDAGNMPKKRKVFPYWIAASIVILLVSGVYLSNLNTENTNTPVVEATKENNIPEKQEPFHKESIIVVQENTEKETPAVKKERRPVTQKAVVAHHTPEDTEKKARSFEDQKVDEVVAQIQKLQQEKAVTEAEIDALLAAAQKAIRSKHKLTTTTTGKIDAMALLEGVEEELDQSFKERVFEALKENFFKVTTAVAERNN